VERGELGPADITELLDDAVDLAIREQEAAGIDILTDGEMRRAGFFTAAFYGHLTGLRPSPPGRLLGPSGHDQQHRFEVVEPITAPTGLGVVTEYVYARSRTSKPLKMTIPGPFTLSGRLASGPGQVYPDRLSAAWAFVPILNAELRALAAAGVDFVQVDEPSPAIHPEAQADFAGLLNATLDGIIGMRVAVHLCFGNYMGRPLAKRTYRPILGSMLAFRADELVLEFANREMAELDLLAEIAPHRDLAIGVVDVKSYYLETAEDVAERIDRVLAAGVPADRLTLVPDCGFSQTARWAARAKLHALVDGTRLLAGRA
jgi:5-methyltetrahydropteroyltriglutamate--homocysteine methyltransferase